MKTSSSAWILCVLVGIAVLSSTVNAKDDPKKFQAAIDSVSDNCKALSMVCLQASDKAKQLFTDGHFCELMKLTDGGTSTKACLTATNGCTLAEYNKVTDAVCGATSVVVSLAVVMIGVVASIFGK
ncbi:hypothetical protein ElyMa_000213000 [Elysia marginata]|uniref:Transmembrane protein n=1 Tax=Elysia marginata TaxID=1093978 RepID=A0AAV4EXR7_9GAST|nr:hypothetical protein ElyMa_000213000 [Elysia marginata]